MTHCRAPSGTYRGERYVSSRLPQLTHDFPFFMLDLPLAGAFAQGLGAVPYPPNLADGGACHLLVMSQLGINWNNKTKSVTISVCTDGFLSPPTPLP